MNKRRHVGAAITSIFENMAFGVEYEDHLCMDVRGTPSLLHKERRNEIKKIVRIFKSIDLRAEL